MNITLSDEATKQSIPSIRRCFADDLDQDIGDLKATLVDKPGARRSVK